MFHAIYQKKKKVQYACTLEYSGIKCAKESLAITAAPQTEF